MKHQKKGKKFHRTKGQREAFIQGLVSNLIQKEKIQTTDVRAKTLKTEAEKMITLAKKQNTASLRLLIARLPRKSAQKLYYEIAPRYAERKGGYIRVIKQGKRRIGDAAMTSMVEFV
ncbi:50S ribosomal protein L17 [Candidatus Wolfebacteria bacterium RIFCSPHIGHO2_01_FULL_48_22]|uniref:50S ribosomal protein L17 n=2 Tax=Candidatus Wolfeibacteriota TaxID=1752735 RepID=A0A1F8DQN5_9BACT|nr:MAG: 50S ribosomal protein L17 [Candidatus Wolfebacteria bacterium RIFCSPHIGHO2_01_FULL_48_22]OGM91994.1 MAG: 50S ribosomal protein L17 [Candidatus Wolfebacteria bacterium RIFCSPLOWO2_01_FULL_47_17b]